MEDKPRTDLEQAEDKKDLRRAAYRGKVQFYRNFCETIHVLYRCELYTAIRKVHQTIFIQTSKTNLLFF